MTTSIPTGGYAVMAQRREPPDALDLFPTPPFATRALLEHVIGDVRGGIAWEPACGYGHMSDVLRAPPNEVFVDDRPIAEVLAAHPRFERPAVLKVDTDGHDAVILQAAEPVLRDAHPVLFFEPKRRYWQKGPVDLDNAPAGMHQATVLRQGKDVTIAAYGPMVATALQAAELGAAEGRSIEVIDMRSMSPIDYATILESVKKTGHLIVTHEANTNVSVSSEVAARVAELAFYHLEAPVLRVGGFDVPYPAAKLEEKFLPDADRLLEAVDRSLGY